MAINIDYDIENENELNIRVDLSETHGKSKSGKTVVIASTQGNMKLETPNGTVYLGLNVYKYPEEK